MVGDRVRQLLTPGDFAALAEGAEVVVAGRVADPSLALAALRHGHGWAADDWPRLEALVRERLAA